MSSSWERWPRTEDGTELECSCACGQTAADCKQTNAIWVAEHMDTESKRLGWIEYDMIATWCAKRGLKGCAGDPLPDGMSDRCGVLINADPEAFEKRVRETAYALARAAAEEA